LWVDAGAAGNCYGPVDLQYCASGTTAFAAANSAKGAKAQFRAERLDGSLPPPVAKIFLSSEGQVRLLLSGHAGQQWRILASEDMSVWASIGEATVGGNGLYEFTDTTAKNSRNRFYLLKSP